MVVEDNPVNRKVVTLMLRRMGVTSETAENGLIGVQMARESHFDLVLMDIHMPVMNGLDAMKELKTHLTADRPPPPVIAVTADAMKGSAQQLLDAGFDGYLSKPIRLQELATAVEGLGIGIRSAPQCR